jgi:hypothetical protein
MDLALATGRGEPLLTEWPNVGAPLVADVDAIQVGDRETEPAEGSGTGTLEPSIAQLTVQEILRRGVAEVSDLVVEHLQRRAWIGSGSTWTWTCSTKASFRRSIRPAAPVWTSRNSRISLRDSLEPAA